MKFLLQIIKRNWLSAALFLLLLCTSVIFLLKPIYDNDFFWHLKAGEWIWQNGRLPEHDIFNFNTPAEVTSAIRFTLTSYWLSQEMFYLAFLGGGMGGIVALRFLFMAVIVYTMFKRMQGDEVVKLSLLVLFSIMLLNFYFFERPQTLSFLFFGLMLYFLERIRSTVLSGCAGGEPAKSDFNTFFLAAVMFLWANSHGGHLLGQVTLIIVLVMEGLKFLHNNLNPLPHKGYFKLVIACMAGIICSVINPNNYQALQLMLQTRAGDPSAQIVEYSTMFEHYNTSHAPVMIIYFAMIAITGLVLLAFPRKMDITEIVLLIFLGYFSLKHVRYAAFFPIAALPVLGKRLSCDMFVRYGRWLLPPLALFTAVYCVQREFLVNIATAREGSWFSSQRFPEKVADFIVANNIQGNMYNPYNWGGYLIWRLAPERKVYADGRNLNIDVFQQSSFKSLLEKQRINYVITYSHEPTGEITRMASELLMDKEWTPVFLDRVSSSAIFVRNVPENAKILANRHYISF